jgi:hypothetical protein
LALGNHHIIEIHLNIIYEFCSYLTENTTRILYEDQSVIASVLETMRNTTIICGHDAELLNVATTGAFKSLNVMRACARACVCVFFLST